MAYQTRRFPGEPIIYFAILPPLEMEDNEKILAETNAFKKEAGGHVYRIVDVTGAQMTFDQMINAMSAERNREGGPNDPLVTLIFVGSGELAEFGVKAMREQQQYGKVSVQMFSSLDAALAEARAMIAKAR